MFKQLRRCVHDLRLIIIEILRRVYEINISTGGVSPDGAVDVQIQLRPFA